MKQYSWSTKDLDQFFGSYDSVAEALADCHATCTEIMVGENVPNHIEDIFPDADDIIEQMECQDAARDDGLDISPEDKADLDKRLKEMLTSWTTERNISLNTFQVINIKKYDPLTGECIGEVE